MQDGRTGARIVRGDQREAIPLYDEETPGALYDVGVFGRNGTSFHRLVERHERIFRYRIKKEKMPMEQNELERIVKECRTKRQVLRELKRLGYTNAKRYGPTKGTSAVDVVNAELFEIEEDKGRYTLNASVHHLNGYEFVWVERDRNEGFRTDVDIMVRKI